MAWNLKFLLKNLTPGTMRLQEDSDPEDIVVGPLYVKNHAWQADADKGGEVIGYGCVLTPIYAAKQAPAKKATTPAKKAAARRPASAKP